MTYRWGTWLFLRGLALCNLIAFLSLWWQVDGLFGSHGITPAAELAEAVMQRHGDAWWYRSPSLFWLAPSDATLQGLCLAGVVASTFAVLDLLPGPMLLVCWVCYLSLSHAGGLFLGYQWDTLLTETTLLGVLAAPWVVRSRDFADPDWLVRWALWLLAARLMFFAGWVKLASEDPTWANCTALTYHYETQPIPNPVSWYAHQLPDWAHWVACEATLGIELLLPFALLAGRWGRLAFATLGSALMLGLFATGNYGFFQILTVALLLTLVDDGHWTWLRGHNRSYSPIAVQRPWLSWRTPLAAALIYAALLQSQVQWWGYPALSQRAQEQVAALGPWRSVNRYGLFAVMTTHRGEIRIEGSPDGRAWKQYVLPYQPGPVDRPPPLAAPHMPRLDWQMWFAALGSCDRNPWLVRLQQRLLDGDDEVRTLFAHDPFPDVPPAHVRTSIQLYRFTDGGNDWWEPVGERLRYCPPMSR